jgi:hypothetical protein
MKPTSDAQFAKARQNAVKKSHDRWANRERKKFFYNGENLTVKEWCDRIGIPKGTFWRRVHDGWPMSRIVATPNRFAVREGETHRACACCGEVYPIEEYVRMKGSRRTTKRKCTACEYQIRERGIEIGRYGISTKFDKLIMSTPWPGTVEELSGCLRVYTDP